MDSTIAGACVPVRLSTLGRVHAFLPADPPLAEPVSSGDVLVVQTELGPALGTAAGYPAEWALKQALPLDPTLRILRRATPDDLALRARQQVREQEAFRVALLKIRERALPMKLARVEQLFDHSRLIFYFTSEGRVDFRELVRELAAEFKVRIEMRQIGVRDEAKLLAGYGSCGRPLCCSTWLRSFEPVSIKMAKQQDLTLNPSKLSGLCGRLKCCLRFELAVSPVRNHDGASDEPPCPGCSGSCAS
jgi:cell fate regulator YaaT (PSP1 superfamily)